jgi:pyruvate/oxaloacetate carboxyltransferase
MSAEKWGVGLFFINWKHILKIWRERCEDTHGTTPEQIEKSLKARLLEATWHIQTTNADLANSDHSWILESIEAISVTTAKC